MKEFFFKITPMSAPVVDIGIKPPIISGLAYTNFYKTIFYYWNGKSYTTAIDFIEDIRKPKKYYADDVYAGIDEVFESALYSAIDGADDDAPAGELITKPFFENYEICIGAIAGGDE